MSHHRLLVLESYGFVNNTVLSIGYMLSSQTEPNVFVLITLFHYFYQSLVVFHQAVCLDLFCFINNMSVFRHPKHALSEMLLYADDLKLFSADHIDLQESITNINSWMESYQLSLAPAKC